MLWKGLMRLPSPHTLHRLHFSLLRLLSRWLGGCASRGYWVIGLTLTLLSGWVLAPAGEVFSVPFGVRLKLGSGLPPSLQGVAVTERQPRDRGKTSLPRVEDWPRFLGPRGDGTSLETGLLKTWSSQGPSLVWSRRLGTSFSPPVVAGRRLFVLHRIANQEILECMEASTGVPLWSQGYPTSYVDRYGYNGGPRSSPTIAGGAVYTFGSEGKLTRFDFHTGKIRWQRWINRDHDVPQNFFGVGAAPLIDAKRILLNAGGPSGAGVMAIDTETGKTLWKTSNDGASYSTPIVSSIGGKRLGIFFTRAGLLAVDTRTGREKYRYRFRSRAHESVNAATPVVIGNYVFLSATYNTGAVLLKLEPTGLQEIWKGRRVMQNHWATSIYHEGYLYGMDGRHEAGANFRCIEFMTGQVRWQVDPGLGRCTFIMVEGHLVALGERGHLALIEVNPDRYRERARSSRILRYPCWAPPALSHGLLYVRNEERLLCLDLRADPAAERGAEQN